MNRPPHRWRRGLAAGVLAVLPLLAGVGAMVLRPEVATAAWQGLARNALPWTVRGGIEHGIYFGWASLEDGILRLAGHVCSADNPVVTVAIPLAGETLTLGAGDVRTEHADLGLPERVAALSLQPREASLRRLRAAAVATHGATDAALDTTPDATHAATPDTTPDTTRLHPRETTFRHLVARCRGGAETRAGVGIATWMVLPAPPLNEPASTVRVVAARSAPHLGVLAALVVANEGNDPVILARVTYAPTGTATGRVRAAAGSTAQLAAWRWRSTGPGNGAVDPAGLTPWHAAFQSPSDPRAMRLRSADALDLPLGPGEVAMIVIDQDSLTAAHPPRRVILYPVLSVTSGDGGSTSGSTGSSTGTTRTVRFVASPLPAVGWTASERQAEAASPPRTDETEHR